MNKQEPDLGKAPLRTLPKVAVTLVAVWALCSIIVSVFSPSFSYIWYIGSIAISGSNPNAAVDSFNNSTPLDRTQVSGFEVTERPPQEEAQHKTVLPSPPKIEEPVGGFSVANETVAKSSSELSMKNKDTTPQEESCDLFVGDWIPNPEGPYYTNETCYSMHDQQNCMKYGMPNMDHVKWRWKPDGCELPIFDPHQFLQIVKGKSIAFVGDSMARNQMQSLMCLLSRVVYPFGLSSSDVNSENQDWMYVDYNFRVSLFWSTNLVRSERAEMENAFGPYHIYLDEYDEKWTSKVEKYDYIIISSGQWFLKANLFYEDGHLIGCVACHRENVKELPDIFYVYKMAFRTALRAINNLENFKGVIILRTISPTHFEGGEWNEGGDCVRTRPFGRNEVSLGGYFSEMRRISLQEFKAAEEEGSKKGLRFRVLDVSWAMQLRPDGHPSKYGHPPEYKVTRDCTHWCLPGPVESWNDFLLQVLKLEERKGS